MIYDVAIIGGGPGGYSAAFEARKHGLSVVLFEKDKLGGTCLNRGCVPTKYLLNISKIYHDFLTSKELGIVADSISLDYSCIKNNMYEKIEVLRSGLESNLTQKGVNIVYGEAIVYPDKKVICNAVEYYSKYVIIASGSKSTKPILKGAISSDELLCFSNVPSSILIVGGGVIAVEFAFILNQLGSNVTMVVRGERILRNWDKELAVGAAQLLKKRGITIRTNCDVQSINSDEYDVVLSAVGRVANCDGFEKLPLGIGDKGGITVDSVGETDISGIYAIGDVINGSDMLAHMAMQQGRNVIKHIIGENISSSVTSECIYLSPEIVSVGYTEKKAKESGIDVVTGKVNMLSNAMTVISDTGRAFVKMIAERETHKIIGVQMMCERASDIAGEFLVIIDNGITVEELMKTAHVHPSFSEAIFDAAERITDGV